MNCNTVKHSQLQTQTSIQMINTHKIISSSLAGRIMSWFIQHRVWVVLSRRKSIKQAIDTELHGLLSEYKSNEASTQHSNGSFDSRNNISSTKNSFESFENKGNIGHHQQQKTESSKKSIHCNIERPTIYHSSLSDWVEETGPTVNKINGKNIFEQLLDIIIESSS